ncbi:MAG: hypothetical protein Q8L20_04915 [Gammaproteobacteria bacterium]|nr:hypothetical protein [Gammaproteobacteria bacterium]MDP2346490.1 hypothetical protein [Gammaproteobacteria bacterium]
MNPSMGARHPPSLAADGPAWLRPTSQIYFSGNRPVGSTTMWNELAMVPHEPNSWMSNALADTHASAIPTPHKW